MLQTPLIGFHKDAGARLVDFAGWEMPVVYAGIIEEHNHTRNHATFFDVSHMGRVRFRGNDAEALLERLNTRAIAGMAVGQSRYSHMLREDGGILDDVIVTRLEDHFLVVCNASNRVKLLDWWDRHLAGTDVQITDETTETAMIAIQGPEAIETIESLLPFQVSDLKRYHCRAGFIAGAEYIISRTGYTGEDGLEIIMPAAFAPSAAHMLVEKSAEKGRPILPAGLGARDTLRTEAAMPLYGHELTEEWDPISAGQAWVVKFEKEFIGRDTCLRVRDAGPMRKLIGLEVDSKRTPRQGAVIRADGEDVGVVTSGVSSPTLGRVIAMGFVPPQLAEAGTSLEVVISRDVAPARVVAMPFYKRG
ncbi:MAG: glycine cleavage system aminomethyltransferase GcvT [Phycisphaerales bacterium]|nr:glycine cleavage system aminomethyltransferase GcvT [Phycisphaerales bacterium]